MSELVKVESNVPAPQFRFNELVQIAKALAHSGLFGIRTEDQAIALCLIAQAEGKHPATAALEYNIIQGRPALNADAMLARHQATGGRVAWTCYSAERVTGIFSHPQGGEVEITWDDARAKEAGLLGKDNWQKWRAQMKRARCISEGVRTVNPGCLIGMYTPEEVADFEPAKPVTVKPSQVITDAEIVDTPPPVDNTPQWFEVWPIEQHADYKVSKVLPDPRAADSYWYTLTYDGVTAECLYVPSTPDSKQAAKENLVTDKIHGRVVTGNKYPRITHVKFKADTADCPPVKDQLFEAELSGPLSPGD